MSGLADGKLKFEFRVGLERETWERAMGAQLCTGTKGAE